MSHHVLLGLLVHEFCSQKIATFCVELAKWSVICMQNLSNAVRLQTIRISGEYNYVQGGLPRSTEQARPLHIPTGRSVPDFCSH